MVRELPCKQCDVGSNPTISTRPSEAASLHELCGGARARSISPNYPTGRGSTFRPCECLGSTPRSGTNDGGIAQLTRGTAPKSWSTLAVATHPCVAQSGRGDGFKSRSVSVRVRPQVRTALIDAVSCPCGVNGTPQHLRTVTVRVRLPARARLLT